MLLKTLNNNQIRYVKALQENLCQGLPLRMGTGKTAIGLETLKLDKEKYSLKKQIALVIAPLNVCYTVWQEQAKEFNYDFTFHILHGEGIKDIPEADIYLINPEGLLRKNLRLPICHALIIDESTKFKNARSKRFLVIKKILHLFKRRCIMTGTPTTKSLMDLWAQIYILDQGKSLGDNFWKFKSNYFYQPYAKSFTWNLKTGAYQTILNRIKPIFNHYEEKNIRFVKYNNIPVKLQGTDYKKYNTFEKTFILDHIEAANTAALRIKLRQLTSGAIYDSDKEINFIHNDKTKALQDLIDSQQGDPLIVFYNFNFEPLLIQQKIPECTTKIDGSTKKTLSIKIIEDWNKGNVPVLLANPASMAYGLNLQSGGATICWFSLTEDLEIYQQANARLIRMGQPRKVIVHHLLVANTIDNVVMNSLIGKGNVQEGVLEFLKKKRQEYNQPTRKIK